MGVVTQIKDLDNTSTRGSPTGSVMRFCVEYETYPQNQLITYHLPLTTYHCAVGATKYLDIRRLFVLQWGVNPNGKEYDT